MGTGTMLERLDAAYDDGRYAEVIQLYAEMRANGEADATAHTLGAGSYLAQRNLPEAQDAIGRALMSAARWPLRGHILFSAAIIASEAGQPHVALEWLGTFLVQAVHDHPKLPHAHFCRGLAYRETGDYGLAVDAYRQALRLYEAAGDTAMVCACYQNIAWAECLGSGREAAQQALALAAPLVGDDESQDHQQVGELYAALLWGDFPVEQAKTLAMNPVAPQGVRCHAAWLLACHYEDGVTADATNARLWLDQAAALAEGLHPRYMRDVAKVRERIDRM